MQKNQTVAKVKAQTWAGVITGLIVSALMAWGMSATAPELAVIQVFLPLALTTLITVGVGYWRGYMKADPERDALWAIIESVGNNADPHAIEEYIKGLQSLPETK